MIQSFHYDEIYKDKPYEAEVRYVYENLLESHCESLLDLGCGTGRHGECFKRLGIDVLGVDKDAHMIETARTRIEAQWDDVRTFRHPSRCFDAVVSLFHVASYQLTYADLRAYFKVAEAHLKAQGRFVFDFWHGPGVLTDLPDVRMKKVSRYLRVATPTMRPLENCVDVKYEWREQTETIRMRYWFMPELEAQLDWAGLRIEKAEKWLGGALGFDWSGCVVARKK